MPVATDDYNIRGEATAKMYDPFLFRNSKHFQGQRVHVDCNAMGGVWGEAPGENYLPLNF